MMSSRFNHVGSVMKFSKDFQVIEIDSCFSRPYIKLNTFSVSGDFII